ncbi:MAG: hypothetical protein KDK36_11570, partial [Leptospiraceae bacterium]|nr:hypothetical protein [Leptospiraceae bacterium]
MISFLKNTLLIFIIICNFLNCKINQNNPEEDKEPLDLTKLEKGIDVSHHQGKINWKKVKSSGIEFTFIKASDGLNFHDSKFLFNW